nr:acyltransferase [Limisphaera ngatamarikiensis]
MRTTPTCPTSVPPRSRWWTRPFRLLSRLTDPVPINLWIVNVFFQRILQINGSIPWQVHFTSRVTGNITIGRNVWKSFALSGGCYIQGINGVEIGDDTIFAPGVKIISANHDPRDYSRWIPAPPIRIGKRCWIGANAVILPGVQLGDDVIVGAGAVVTKSFPSGSVLVGVPARPLERGTAVTIRASG